jgi:exodeoxyribonuclease VII small subunit
MTDEKKGKKKGEDLKFEQAFARLEEIVNSLDEGGLPLEELESRFEEGLTLVKFCGDRLNAIEKRVEKLVETPSGELVTEDFQAETQQKTKAESDDLPF